MKTRAIGAGRRPSRRRKTRNGFSLIEVMVAMTLISILLMGLARVTFQMAAASRGTDTVAKRNAALIQEANKFNAMSFDSLATVNTSTKDVTFGDFKFQRRLTITTVSSRHKTIKIVATPYIAGVLTANKKDSVFVTRTKPAGSPLCTTC
jgi:prepilin-type N-terminal cleavage/methylation domain-containing protein